MGDARTDIHLYRYDLTYFGSLIIAGMVSRAPDVRDGKSECFFLRNRNAQPVRIGWMFKYIYFYFYPLLVVEPILLLLLPFADGATMRR